MNIPNVRFNYTNTPQVNQYTAPVCPEIKPFRLGNTTRENFGVNNVPSNVPAPVCNQLQGYPRTSVTSNFIRDRAVPTPFDLGYGSPVNNPPATRVYVRLGKANGKSCFVLNHKTMPRLLLKRNSKYQFNIVTQNCPFYFSSKPFGPPDIFGIPPVSYDLRTYVIGPNVPDTFYYTSTQNENLVGVVKII